MTSELERLVIAENAAYEALCNDPKVIADPSSTHTPELLEAWEKAADQERAYREKHGIIWEDKTDPNAN